MRTWIVKPIVVLRTSHDFADHRLALSAAVVDWLDGLADRK